MDDSTPSTTEAATQITEAPNTDITTETSIPPVEDKQPTTQEDVVATEDQITSETTEASVDEVDGLTVTELTSDTTTEASVDEVDGLVVTEITSDTTEASVDEVNGLVATEISTSEEPVNENVTTKTSTPLIEDVPILELDVQEAIEGATSAEPTISTEPTVTQAEEVQTSTTEQDVATSEIDAPGEPITDTTDLSVAVDQDQGELIDVATTESLGEDVSFPTSANETDVGASNDSAIGVAKFSVLLSGDEQLPTTEVDLKETSEVGTSTESVLDVTTEPSVPLPVDEQLATDDSDIKESTDLVSSIEPVVVSTTEAIIPLAVNVELKEEDKTEVGTPDTTVDESNIVKNNLQTTQTNGESLNDGATVTPVSPIDPSELSIRSNKARNDLEAISPLTLAEAPKEVVPTQEVDSFKDMKADEKVEDASVGATTSVNKAGGVDKSVIGVIVAGMVVVVAGITIKKNWKSIKNKFSSSPRPANDRTNHTNGIAPEEVPLQEKDNKNPSPV